MTEMNGVFPDSLNNAFQKTAQKYDNRSESIAKGRVTGSISAVLGDSVTNERIYSTVYYNNRGEENVIYQSNLLGGYDVTSMERGYLGNITSKYCEHHSVAGVIKEQFDYTYDHHQRLVNESYTWNDKSMGNIIHNEYDALGRLARSRQGSSSRLQRTYAYNVRSQLTSSSSPLFTEKIYYESPRNNGVTPCFNGDISSVSWSDKTAISRTSDMRHYDYSYDALDRLTDSRYSDYKNRTRFYDTYYMYDKQGNILNLGRHNVDPTDNTRTNLVDDASFRYDGNQLMAYSDIGMETSSQDITLPDNYDDIDGSDQFSYDACGNMTANTNKGIVKMTYNLLNQPASIYFRDGTVIRYDYSADGERLRARYGTVKYNVAIPEAGIMTADFLPSDTTGYSMTSSDIYDGRYTYRSYYYYKRSRYAKYKTYKTSLLRIRIDGGIVTDFSAGNPSLLFELADHQGNIRYVATASGAYITMYQYYPFGGYFDGGTKYPYLYGGKEMEKCNGLDEYDFEARNYDPALCRFNTMDPLSEKYYSISPYAYCADNPISRVDMNGKEWTYTIDGSGHITITLSVNFSAGEDFSQSQIENYKNAISTGFNQVISDASDGNVSGVIKFYGGNNDIVQSLKLSSEKGSNIAGNTGCMASNVNVNDKFGKLKSYSSVAMDVIHEFLHTLRIDHPFERTQTEDTKLINVGPNSFVTTPSTSPDILHNIMNYPMTIINGRTSNVQNTLTKGQLKLMLEEIDLQKQGYGFIPKYNKSLTPEQNKELYDKYYDNYWNGDWPGYPVQ